MRFVQRQENIMYHNIPDPIREQMRRLEEIDTKDRTDGTPRMQRLRQIPFETGQFLAILAASAPSGVFIEIGTSAGYSALHLALACRAVGARLITFEVLEDKLKLARETIERAGVSDVVELFAGDARDVLADYRDVAFCFIDCEKEMYGDCYDLVIPNMVDGGILIADNVISHEQDLHPFVQKVLDDERMDAVVVPIGKGELVGRKVQTE
jgi:predicted O-methyltransferase YrrM